MPYRLLLAVLLAAVPLLPASHVVLVSIDGLAAYHLYNAELELPNIRELIKDGAWAASSETVFPSVTHPSHTTIVTGVSPRRHGVLSNSLVNRRTGERFHPTNKPHSEVVLVPTIFDAAKDAGLTTAAFFWPETKDDSSIDFNLPEVFNDRKAADIDAVSPALLEELRAAGVEVDLFFRWYGSERRSAGDVVLAESAAHVIKVHKPNLLAIHFVSTDATQHDHGPHHYRSQAALSMADHCVGVLREAVREAGLKADTTFIVGADHGFHSVCQEASVEPAFRDLALAGKVRLHGGGWTIAVELTEEFEAAADLPKLEASFAKVRQAGIVNRIVGPEQMHALGLPRYEESDYARGHYLLIPDIDTYLTTGPADSFERQPKRQPSHSHGYLPQHPRMYPALLLSGRGVRRGVTVGHTSNLNIAPTIAKLLGFQMNGLPGEAIEAALDPE